MHDLLAHTQSMVVAQFPLLGFLNAVWPYLLMLAGFSVIVFVHELGHFMVAKWAGVRVQTFAIGFGREIVGFTIGETRYSFNLLPLGGYVKMLGQEDFDDKAKELRFKDDPRSFVNKPVGQRMAIISAGVIMNVLFACLLFMIVFMVGMEAPGTRIAYVDPDSPAEKAGLQAGDRIRKINGETVLEFNEISFAVMLSPPHEPIEFLVERDDGTLESIHLTPEYDRPETTRTARRQIVGIGPGKTAEIIGVGPEIDVTRPDHPHVGDVLIEVDGMEINNANASRMLNILAYTSGDVLVERQDPKDPNAPPQRIRVNIPPILALYPSDPRDQNTISVLGLTPLVRFAIIDGRGRAYLAGIEAGDTVLRWDDQPHPSKAAISRAVRDHSERDIPFTIRKPDGRIVEGFVRPKRHKRGAATIHALAERIDPDDRSTDGPKARFVGVRHFGAAYRAGIRNGDVILAYDDKPNPTSSTFNRWVRCKAGKSIALKLETADGREVDIVVISQPPGAIDAVYTFVAHDLLKIGNIVQTIDGRPSPAAEAGIPAGVRILAIDDQPLEGWLDLIDAFRERAGSTVELAYEDHDHQRKVVAFRIPHCLRTLLGVGPQARILSIDGQETVKVKKGNGSEELSVRYRQGTQALLAELIGQTQVPVEYRKDLLSEIQTAHIDVTEDMVDPWLARVALSPNIGLADEMVLLKGENAFDAIKIGVHKTYYFILMVYKIGERMIFSRSVSVEHMSGPLGIIDIGGQIARRGAVKFLFFLAIISANLAVINFLPLPIVDGGMMVFLIIEKIKGSPISLRVQVATQMIGIFLLIGAFVFVTYQDAMRMWG